jgi:polyisoprenoid-binding protein YceI
MGTLSTGFAALWQMDPADSSITFTATQNNSPVSGQFKTFKSNIDFDPAELNKSHVTITVDMNSVSTSYKEVGDTLKTPDWFNVKIFPQAVFKATHFTKTGDNSYTANGSLTMRDKTVPVTLRFVLDEYTPNKAHAKGSTTLKRSAFGMGQGDWAKTDDLKDDIEINFILAATKK